MSHDSTKDDPIIASLVERALEPYRALLPPEDIVFFERMLRLFYKTHPKVAPLLAEMRREAMREASGKIGRDASAEPTPHKEVG